jgi:regulator of sirC expression with transglutaminase-like and TPR domain
MSAAPRKTPQQLIREIEEALHRLPPEAVNSVTGRAMVYEYLGISLRRYLLNHFGEKLEQPPIAEAAMKLQDALEQFSRALHEAIHVLEPV